MKHLAHYCFLLVLTIVCIGCFFFVYPFVTLNLDDYCRATWDINNYVLNVKEWYFHHNGRYTNALLTSLPIYEKPMMQFSLITLFVINITALFYFITSLFHVAFNQIDFKFVFLTSILILSSIISFMPDIQSYLYWIAGATVYSFSASLILFISGLLIRAVSFKKTLILALLIILLIGSSELYIIAVSFGLMVKQIAVFLSSKKLSYKVLFLQLIAVISSLAVYLSPGTSNRHGLMKSGGKFLASIYHSVTESLSFSFQIFFSLEGFFLIAIFMALSLILHRENPSRKISLSGILVFSISAIILMTVVFILYYAAGFFVERDGRVGNVITLIVILLLFLNIFTQMRYLICKNIVVNAIPLTYLYLTLALAFVGCIYNSTNYRLIYTEISQNNFLEREKSINKRDLLIRQAVINNDEVLTLSLLKESKLLPDNNYLITEELWLEGCLLEYYNKVYQADFKQIKITK